MGNSLRKEVQEPNQPVSTPQPPPGGKDAQFSRPVKTFGQLRVRDSFKEIGARKEKGSEVRGRDFPSITRDGPLPLVNRDEVLPAYKLNCFCYSTLKAATGKFSKKNLIGQGGFGDVYRGCIHYCSMSAARPGDGTAIAVKRLRGERAFLGHQEWLNELRFLGTIKHPNVVKLIGYCSEGEHRILVYEYMVRGSLEDHLLRETETELNWSRRIKVALGAARGLDHLHTAGRPVIHRDLKASNVLLDAGFNAKLSDFGLAKFGPQGDKSHVTTKVLGTKGYLAPEYFITGHLTLKSDVYSFGVVLLEILSGSSAAIKKHSNGTVGDLAQWARPYLSNKLELHRVIDKKLGRNFPVEEAYKLAEIILHCLDLERQSRPTMTQVVAALEQLEQNISGCNQNSLRTATFSKRSSLLTTSLETRRMV